jgi:hypothetical protein
MEIINDENACRPRFRLVSVHLETFPILNPVVSSGSRTFSGLMLQACEYRRSGTRPCVWHRNPGIVPRSVAERGQSFRFDQIFEGTLKRLVVVDCYES